ncbi:MAG TPA: hypothetical protein VNQ90_17765 [Chthoniobacteraceae bacterium]|nr:hypothetical protein [Chthoniobacteraceae bacterium]
MTNDQIETLRKMAAKERQNAAYLREITEAYESGKHKKGAASYRVRANLADKQAEALEAALARLQ